jgi:hypothetical protein
MQLLGEINNPRYSFLSIEEHEKALSDEEWNLLIEWFSTRIGTVEVSLIN